MPKIHWWLPLNNNVYKDSKSLTLVVRFMFQWERNTALYRTHFYVNYNVYNLNDRIINSVVFIIVP